MKKYFLLLILLVLGVNLTFSQELKEISEPVFKTGEQLSYKFKYGFFTGAEGTLRVEDGEKIDGHPTYHIIADGKTAGTFDFFYKVRNRYESYVDRTTLLPYLYIENRKEDITETNKNASHQTLLILSVTTTLHSSNRQ